MDTRIISPLPGYEATPTVGPHELVGQLAGQAVGQIDCGSGHVGHGFGHGLGHGFGQADCGKGHGLGHAFGQGFGHGFGHGFGQVDCGKGHGRTHFGFGQGFGHGFGQLGFGQAAVGHGQPHGGSDMANGQPSSLQAHFEPQPTTDITISPNDINTINFFMITPLN